jgi:hypothetical protein
MGLDMYLSKKFYVKNWDHMRPEELHQVIVKRNGEERRDIPSDKVMYIETEVADWRKANAIHKWFVDNVQDGKDDCGTYYVSKEKLIELLELCKKVRNSSVMIEGEVQNGYQGTKEGMKPIMEPGKYIVNPEIAEELLPTQEGFFFGMTNYDQYYMEDIEYTIKVLEKELGTGTDEGDYYYNSSW